MSPLMSPSFLLPPHCLRLARLAFPHTLRNHMHRFRSFLISDLIPENLNPNVMKPSLQLHSLVCPHATMYACVSISNASPTIDEQRSHEGPQIDVHSASHIRAFSCVSLDLAWIISATNGFINSAPFSLDDLSESD